MQNIDGNNNVQISGDSNTIVVNKPFEVNKNSYAAELAMSSQIRSYRIFNKFVEIPMALSLIVIMFVSSEFTKEYFLQIMFFSWLLFYIIWWLLPMKFSSMLGMVHWDKFSIGAHSTIPFRDIHKIVWNGTKGIHIITFNRVHHNITFLSVSGAEDLFEAFGIYTKLR